MPSGLSKLDMAGEGEVENGRRSVRRTHNSSLYSRSVKDVSYVKFSSSPGGKMEFWHF